MTMLFDGVAMGTLLFLISVGLSITLGLMNFVNLAHGALAMTGGYLAVWLLNRMDLPYLLTLPLVFVACAALGAVLERSLYRRLYAASHLDQVLFSVGLLFVATAGAHYLFGPQPQSLTLPAWLRGQQHLGGLDVGNFRLFLVALGLALAFGLQWALTATRLGATLRAAVDHPRTAWAMGLDVDRVLLLSFALGSGLAGLGGALGVEVLGLEPGFPVKYLVYFLMVVAAGGRGNVLGSLAAALVLGVCDVAGKYFAPQVGVFVIYAAMLALLLWRPHGLFGRGAAP